MERYLSRRESAEYLTNRGFRTSPNTLEKLASLGGGPRYSNFGNRALYVPEDLDQWAQQRLRTKHSTSEDAGGANASAA